MDQDFIKLVAIGPHGAGKTSLRYAWANNSFPPEWVTGFNDFDEAPLLIGGKPINVRIYDTFAQEEYARHRAQIYHGATAFLMCFDLDPKKREKHLKDIEENWIYELELEKVDTPWILVGLKSDLLDDTNHPHEDYAEKALDLGAEKYLEASSLYLRGLNEVVLAAVNCAPTSQSLAIKKCMKDIANHFGYPRPTSAPHPPTPIPRSTTHKSNFTEHFKSLFDAQQYCDLTLIPTDSKVGIKVHKFVLSHCVPKFYATIEPLIDPTTNTCPLNTTQEVLKTIMQVIYTWKKSTEDSIVQCSGPLYDKATTFVQEYGLSRAQIVLGQNLDAHPFSTYSLNKISKEKATQLFCDACFDLDHHAIYAHWALLNARSTFFQNFSESFEPTPGQITRIPLERASVNVCSSSVWAQIVAYLYTDSFYADSQLAVLFDLYAQCDRYMLGEHAKDRVQERIEEQVTVLNVLQIWELVKDTKMEAVKNHCLYLMCLHKEELKLTEDTKKAVDLKMTKERWADQQAIQKYQEYKKAVELFKQGQKPYKEFVFPKELGSHEKCLVQ